MTIRFFLYLFLFVGVVTLALKGLYLLLREVVRIIKDWFYPEEKKQWRKR